MICTAVVVVLSINSLWRPRYLFDLVSSGLGAGGQHIQNCRKQFVSCVELLVALANLQTAFITLDEALKVTNRRVNALENVVKPMLENTISYIKVRQHG